MRRFIFILTSLTFVACAHTPPPDPVCLKRGGTWIEPGFCLPPGYKIGGGW